MSELNTTCAPVERPAVVSHGKETVILKTFLARHQELLTVTSDKWRCCETPGEKFSAPNKLHINITTVQDYCENDRFLSPYCSAKQLSHLKPMTH